MSDLEPQKTIFGFPVEEVPIEEIDGRTVYKVASWFAASNEVLIDMSLLDPPPLTPSERRHFKSEDRRRAIIYGIARPLRWLSLGSDWLHVEALNGLFRVFGLNWSVSHDKYEDGDE